MIFLNQLELIRMLIPFFNTSTTVLVPQIMLCVILTLMLYFFGAFFVKKQKFFTSVTIGLSLTAMLISISISYYSIIAKYIILFVFLMSFVLFFKKIMFQMHWKDVLNTIFKSKLVLLFGVFLSILSIFIYIFLNTVNGQSIILEGHQNYFSGISLEIFQANYFDRLKVFDNYPLTWTKYHFFNGSLHSIPLSIFSEKNYLTFFISKLVIISIFIMSIIENLSSKKIKNIFYIFAVIILVITYFLNASIIMTNWSIISNAYSSIFYLLLFLIFLLNNNKDAALFFLLVFTTCLSRTLFIGGFLISVFIYMNTRLNLSKIQSLFHSKNIYIFIIFCLSVFSMIFSGSSPANTSIFDLNIMNIANGWALTLGNYYYVNTPIEISYIYSKSVNYFVLINVVAFLICFKNIYQERQTNFLLIKSDLYLIVFMLIAIFIFIAFFLAFLLPYELSLIIFVYLVPLFQIVILSPNSLRPYFLTFIAISLLQILVFNPKISFPAYAIIDFILIFLIVHNLIFLNIPKKFETGLSLLFICLIFFSKPSLNIDKLFITDKNETTSHEIYENSFYLKSDFDINLHNVYCYEDNNEKSMIASLLGIRSSHSKKKETIYSISLEFISKDGLEYIECKN